MGGKGSRGRGGRARGGALSDRDGAHEHPFQAHGLRKQGERETRTVPG